MNININKNIVEIKARDGYIIIDKDNNKIGQGFCIKNNGYDEEYFYNNYDEIEYVEDDYNEEV